MANIIKAKVAGGEYATESEVIRDGLRAHTMPLRGTRRDDIRPGLRITNYRKRAVIAFSVEKRLKDMYWRGRRSAALNCSVRAAPLS